ncbi:hypothetical protein BDR04DRAFT_1119805 [Suillus decipiens]|nr:hypothetical protein BDR04DRAFT_1119805 [Suillus decipiens]
MSRKYACSAEPGCKQTFIKFHDLKKHEATHSAHAGEQRWICPHDGCDYKTHNPSNLTRHCKSKHGYIPSARSTAQLPSPPLPSGSSHQYQTLPPIYSQSLGVLYGSTDTADDYTMYTGAARAPNGWSEGCMCPELMERRPSEMLDYNYDYSHY